jgi:protein involved in sex pheromone biosynthesis
MERYCLEIYAPDNKSDVLTTLYSEQPFLSINVGEFISQRTLPQHTDSLLELRVTTIMHVLMPSKDGAKHKLMVFTEEVKDIYSAF